MDMINYGNHKRGSIMGEASKQRRWAREEVVILVVEYFRTKNATIDEIEENQMRISKFLRKREEILSGKPVSETYRNYAGIHMQSGRIRCLDPETDYSGMQGTKLQQEVVQEYLHNPEEIKAEAERIYNHYGRV